jgi:hypothetical protein
VFVVRGCFAFADIEASDHQLAICDLAVEQDCQCAAVEPFQLLLLLRLRQVCHAHESSLFVVDGSTNLLPSGSVGRRCTGTS